jgi:transcriptional regulator with XRE-family HTH domain
MTPNDFKELWFRDKAYLMRQPSIDRIDSTKGYEKGNCRYIEFYENSTKETPAKPVAQFSKAGKLIRVWRSISQATKQFRTRNCIRRVLGNPKRSAHGFRWSFIARFPELPLTTNDTQFTIQTMNTKRLPLSLRYLKMNTALSTREIAKAVGVSHPTVYKWLRMEGKGPMFVVEARLEHLASATPPLSALYTDYSAFKSTGKHYTAPSIQKENTNGYND